MPQRNAFFRPSVTMFWKSGQPIDNKVVYCYALVGTASGLGQCRQEAITPPRFMHKVIHSDLEAKKWLKKPTLSKNVNVLH
jgi:hypothetical protein